MRTRSLLAGGAAIAVLAAAGCGGSKSSSSTPAPNPNKAEVNPSGDIPDNQAYVAYAPPGGGYSVKVPEGWSRTAKGGAVVFSDKLNSIQMESASAPKALTAAEATQAASSLRNAKVSTVSRKAGKAVLVTYLTKAAPDAVTNRSGTDAVERYTFFHKQHRVVLTLSGPKGADNVDPWRIVTDSLQWK